MRLSAISNAFSSRDAQTRVFALMTVSFLTTAGRWEGSLRGRTKYPWQKHQARERLTFFLGAQESQGSDFHVRYSSHEIHQHHLLLANRHKHSRGHSQIPEKSIPLPRHATSVLRCLFFLVHGTSSKNYSKHSLLSHTMLSLQ